MRDRVRRLALKRLFCRDLSRFFLQCRVTFPKVVTSGMHYFESPHGPHQDLQTSDFPSLCLLLGLAKSMQRAVQAWSWPEALLTTLGGHKAIFMQPNLPILPSLPRPRIVNDRVLEETPPCHWVLGAKRRGNRAGGPCMRPNLKAPNSKVRGFDSHPPLPRSLPKDWLSPDGTQRGGCGPASQRPLGLCIP